MTHYHVQVINTNSWKIYYDKRVKTKKDAMREMSEIKENHRKTGEMYEGRLEHLWLDNKHDVSAIIAKKHNEKCEVLE